MNTTLSFRSNWNLFSLIPLFLLTSCSEDIDVSTERVGSEAIIYFGISGIFTRRLDPICLRIIEIRENVSKKAIWRISKKGPSCSLRRQVTLGETVPDFAVQVDNLPLKPQDEYVVSIIADEGSVTSGVW